MEVLRTEGSIKKGIFFEKLNYVLNEMRYQNWYRIFLCTHDTINPMNTSQLAAFGAGCFWGVEELYRVLPGILKTEVGYMGGTVDNPTYEMVCGGNTGHVETVQVTYDPQKITYEELLRIFWNNHNPTTPNRQGPDIGTQYRSVIFYYTEEQQEQAEASKQELTEQQRFKDPIVTEIIPATTFWSAEEYHQQYLAKRGLGSCHI